MRAGTLGAVPEMTWWMWPVVGLLAIWAVELVACLVVFAGVLVERVL